MQCGYMPYQRYLAEGRFTIRSVVKTTTCASFALFIEATSRERKIGQILLKPQFLNAKQMQISKYQVFGFCFNQSSESVPHTEYWQMDNRTSPHCSYGFIKNTKN
jgi:hypothetical protein